MSKKCTCHNLHPLINNSVQTKNNIPQTASIKSSGNRSCRITISSIVLPLNNLSFPVEHVYKIIPYIGSKFYTSGGITLMPVMMVTPLK